MEDGESLEAVVRRKLRQLGIPYSKVTLVQSWALSAFSNFFNNKK